MVDLNAVESSMIAAVGYSADDQLMVILFNNGKAYEYYNVPQETYEGLMQAESKGRFMQDQVIKVFPYAPFRGWKKQE